MPGNTGGDSERVMGEWLTARGNRSDVIIATKVAKWPVHPGLSPDNIRAAVEPLRNLQTDYIDVYYAHEDDPSVPMAETLAAFDELVRSGKVRCIAASNFTADRLLEALAVSAENGFTSYVAIQNEYNLMERAGYEDGFAAIVLEHGLASLPYYSLARGFLTGKYRPGSRSTVRAPRVPSPTSASEATGCSALCRTPPRRTTRAWRRWPLHGCSPAPHHGAARQRPQHRPVRRPRGDGVAAADRRAARRSGRCLRLIVGHERGRHYGAGLS